MITNRCRFCHQQGLISLFSATQQGREKQADEFACTNCGFGIHGPIVRCQACGIVYVNEKVSQKQISTYYEVAQDPLYFKEQNARQKTFQNYLRKLEKIFPHKGKLLDIGTNTGLFVKLAANSGWDAAGLEPNKWAVDYAKKNYSVKIIARPFAKGIFRAASFDVITMWDVIEHFTDPIAEMEKVYWYLRPQGLFTFSTVDPESQFARLMGTHWSWYMEMHRAFLPRKTARLYLTKTGFQKIIFSRHWRKLSLGYLASRLQAVNPSLSTISQRVINSLGLSKIIIPYYANDLYDCYAFK